MNLLEETTNKMKKLEDKARLKYAKSLETNEAILALSINDKKEYDKLKTIYLRENRKKWEAKKKS